MKPLHALISLLLGAALASAQTGSISGVVTDRSDARPLSKALVVLTAKINGEDCRAQSVTNGEGRFSFTKLPAGKFQLMAQHPGYVVQFYGGLRLGKLRQ